MVLVHIGESGVLLPGAWPHFVECDRAPAQLTQPYRRRHAGYRLDQPVVVPDVRPRAVFRRLPGASLSAQQPTPLTYDSGASLPVALW